MINRMPTPEPPPSLATLRFVVTAVIVGSCVVGGTVIFSASRIGGKMFVDSISYIVGGVACLVLFAQAVAAPIFLTKPPRNVEESTLVRFFGTEVLLRVAVLECGIAITYLFYLLSPDVVILIAGTGLLIALICLRPSASRYFKWRERL
jgi:hypothetical protein